MAVGANQRVGIGDGLAVRHFVGPNGLREIFEVDLVADAGAWRHDAEVLKRALAPFQKVVTLDVAFVFEFDVASDGFVAAEFVNDDRVVDDEVNRHQRVDLFRIAAKFGHAIAHGGQINNGGDSGEVLHQDARRAEANFLPRRAFVRQPFRHSRDIGLSDGATVLMAKQVFKQNFHRKRQLGNPFEAVLLGIGQRIVNVTLAIDSQGLQAFEAIEGNGRECAQGQSSYGRRRAAPPECRRIEAFTAT